MTIRLMQGRWYRDETNRIGIARENDWGDGRGPYFEICGCDFNKDGTGRDDPESRIVEEIIWHSAPSAEGRKDDAGKARIDLIAPEFLFGTAAVLEFGAAKYAERNWEKGMSWGRCFGALMRHMWAWWGGEQKDAETGMSHLAHAACCLMFLMAYENRKIGTDDRSA